MSIVSHPANKNYRDHFEETFGKKAEPKTDTVVEGWTCRCGTWNATVAFPTMCWKCGKLRG